MTTCRAVAAAILLAACGEEAPVVTIREFATRSPLVECAQMGRPDAEVASIATLQPVDDSSFLLVDDGTPQVLRLDGALRVRTVHAVPRAGPGGVARLMDAAMSGDSLLVLADGGFNQLVGLGAGGAVRWIEEMDFPPQRIAFAGARLLVAAVGMDARIPGLLHERVAGGLIPLGIPFVPHEDALARMLINSVAMRALADGSALVAHQLVEARAWRIGASGVASRARVPVPDAAAGRLGQVPPMPLRQKDLDEIATPVLSMTVDPRSGEVFYLTRSGQRVADHQEKALVRLAPDFSYVASNRLRINATEIAFLPARPDSVIVVDAELRWHRCPVPPHSTQVER